MTIQEKTDYSAFTSLIEKILGLVDPKLSKFYLGKVSLVNYAFVCGVGVIINMSILSFLFDFGLGLLVSNALAIFCAFIWNWTFSVGPYGYFFDLQKKPIIVKSGE